MPRKLASAASGWVQPGPGGDPVLRFLAAGCHGGAPCLWAVLAACYAVLALAAAIQLVRIQIRLGQYGLTLQKLFHLLNLLVCVLRATSLGLWNELDKHRGVETVLFDLPNLAFFTSYTLLILFWAEIVHASRPKLLVPPRFVYAFVNLLLYFAALCFWTLSTVVEPGRYSTTLSAYLQAVMSALAVLGFLVYGWRLLLMLKRSPVRSTVRGRKIQEVCLISCIAVACFATKAVLFWISARAMFWMSQQNGMGDKAELNMDKIDLLMNLMFFGFAEVLVIGSCLGILSTLPPRRSPVGYESVDAEDVPSENNLEAQS